MELKTNLDLSDMTRDERLARAKVTTNQNMLATLAIKYNCIEEVIANHESSADVLALIVSHPEFIRPFDIKNIAAHPNANEAVMAALAELEAPAESRSRGPIKIPRPVSPAHDGFGK